MPKVLMCTYVYIYIQILSKCLFVQLFVWCVGFNVSALSPRAYVKVCSLKLAAVNPCLTLVLHTLALNLRPYINLKP